MSSGPQSVAARGTAVVLVAGGAIAACSLLALPFGLAVVGTLLGWAMLAITVSDLRHYIIPDILSLPAIPAGLLASGSLLSADKALLVDPAHVIGMALGGGVLWGLREVYLRRRDIEALGLGDVKLSAAAGAWTGWQGLSHVLLVAAVGALIVVGWQWMRGRSVDRSSRVPFGAFLAPALWLVWMSQTAA